MSLLRELFTCYAPINALNASFGMSVIGKSKNYCSFHITPTTKADKVTIVADKQTYTMIIYKNNKVMYSNAFDKDNVVEMYNQLEKQADLFIPF